MNGYILLHSRRRLAPTARLRVHLCVHRCGDLDRQLVAFAALDRLAPDGARFLRSSGPATRSVPMALARQLEALTGLESRVTILGYVQRGGTPSAMDRLLATQFGTAATALIHQGKNGVMVALKNGSTHPVPLEKVVEKRKIVPLDHYWYETARRVGTCLGD